MLSLLSVDDLSPRDPQFAVVLVKRMLQLGVAQHASDIHLQPRATTWEGVQSAW